MLKKFGDLKPTAIFAIGLICCLAIFVSGLLGVLLRECKLDNEITVEEVLEKSECGYIIKDIETWSILEPSAYLDEEVMEIAVCCDTEDTLCIFISLPTDQERVIVRNP